VVVRCLGDPPALFLIVPHLLPAEGDHDDDVQPDHDGILQKVVFPLLIVFFF
jgi:hypothetical protein